MNKVVLIGRVGKTPEVSVFDNGKKVTKFSLATTEFFGKDNKETNWHNITIWGEYGETMSKYISIGSQISVEGRIQYSAYEKDGVKCVSSTIVTDKVELLDSKKSDTNEDPYQATAKPAVSVSSPKTPVLVPSAPTEDLPF